MGFIDTDSFVLSLLYNVIYLYSGAFLCLFTVRDHLRKRWYVIALTVVATSVPYVLVAQYFDFVTIIYAALSFVYCLWVAKVPPLKMLFIFLMASNYLYLASSIVQLAGIHHLFVLLTIPPIAWLMRRIIWPMLKDIDNMKGAILCLS